MTATARTLPLDLAILTTSDPIVDAAARGAMADPAIAERARAILNKRRARTKSVARKVDQETRLCAIIATLPRSVKVQDIAPIYGLTPTHLSRLRGMAFRGTFAVPEQFKGALSKSFTPRATPSA